MKRYNVTSKKDNVLIFSIVFYDKKTERKMLKQLQKLKSHCNIFEVKE